MFMLGSFLGRFPGGIGKILGPFGIADFDFMARWDASLNTLAAVAPAVWRADIVDAPIFMWATLIDDFHDSPAVSGSYLREEQGSAFALKAEA